jgi:hypothetical protein
MVAIAPEDEAERARQLMDKALAVDTLPEQKGLIASAHYFMLQAIWRELRALREELAAARPAERPAASNSSAPPRPRRAKSRPAGAAKRSRRARAPVADAREAPAAAAEPAAPPA